jgi:hypothetical protein
LIGFLYWITNIKKLTKKIILFFLLEGHGKNRVDKNFGNAKALFKK